MKKKDNSPNQKTSADEKEKEKLLWH